MSGSTDSPNPVGRVARLQDQWRQVSHQPGVYLMKSAAGQVLYVGKARYLKKRLARMRASAWSKLLHIPDSDHLHGFF